MATEKVFIISKSKQKRETFQKAVKPANPYKQRLVNALKHFPYYSFYWCGIHDKATTMGFISV